MKPLTQEFNSVAFEETKDLSPINLSKAKSFKDLFFLLQQEILLGEWVARHKDDPEKVKALTNVMWGVAVRAAREDFYFFVQMMSAEIIPGGKFVPGKHITLMCRELQKVCEQVEYNQTLEQKDFDKLKMDKLQLWVPPRSGKSIIASVLFPLWCLGRNPHWYVLQIGHSTKHVEDNIGALVLGLMQSRPFGLIFPKCTVDPKMASRSSIKTTQKGVYQCTGVGSRIAGKGAHLAISDDVMVDDTAKSKTQREAINDWYIPSFRTRLMKGAGEVMINARWHLNDLSGYITELDEGLGEPWRVIKIPALLDAESAALLGLPENESYWPEMWSLKWIKNMKAANANKPHYWAALYMQDPITEGGAVFSVDDFSVWKDTSLPKFDFILCSIDGALSSKESADYSAVTIWGTFPSLRQSYDGRDVEVSNLFLIYAKRGKYKFNELCQVSEFIRREFNPDLFLIENTASGIPLADELRLRGFYVHLFKPRGAGDKLTRAQAASPVVKEGLVWIPDQNSELTFAELTDFLEEIVRFPYAKNDDFTDSMVQAILWAKQNSQLISENYTASQSGDEAQYRRGPRSYWSALV